MSSRYERAFEGAHGALAPVATLAEERPPEGLARGAIAVPPWVVIGLCAALLLACTAYTVWRFIPAVRR